MEVLAGADAVYQAKGRKLGPGEWFTIDQSRIDGFADITEDHQWIHTTRHAGGHTHGRGGHGGRGGRTWPHGRPLVAAVPRARRHAAKSPP